MTTPEAMTCPARSSPNGSRRCAPRPAGPKQSSPDKIDSDVRQVSPYENGRITPSLEALVRIAETFNVSVDYLVIETTARRPLHAPENILGYQLATLDPDDQAAILKVLDALVTKTQLRPLTRR